MPQCNDGHTRGEKKKEFGWRPERFGSGVGLEFGQSFLPTSGKPPLAIAMPSSQEGKTRLRRYRLVVAKKESLRAGTETVKALNKWDKSLPQCMPGMMDDDYVYGYAADEYRSPLWLLWVRMGHTISLPASVTTGRILVLSSMHGSWCHA